VTRLTTVFVTASRSASPVGSWFGISSPRGGGY
jgi:hypothetical protein